MSEIIEQAALESLVDLLVTKVKSGARKNPSATGSNANGAEMHRALEKRLAKRTGRPPRELPSNVVHVAFGGRAPKSDDIAPLTAAEIAGLRRLFTMCPIARHALTGE